MRLPLLLLLCTISAAWGLDFMCYDYCGYNETSMTVPVDIDRSNDIYCERREIRNPFVMDGRSCLCQGNYIGPTCIDPSPSVQPYKVNFNCRYVNETLNGNEAFVTRVFNVFVTRISSANKTIEEEEQELLQDAMMKDYIEFCGCNIGYGGKYCNETCESSLNNCNNLGSCLYSHYANKYYCQCASGIGRACEAPVAAGAWIIRIVEVYVLFIVYIILFAIGLLIFITQLRSGILAYKRQSTEKGCFKPSLVLISSGLLALALFSKVIYQFLFFIRDTGTLATQGPEFTVIQPADSFFRLFSTVLLIACNANMIFRWAQIVTISSKLRHNQGMNWKERLILIIINVVLFIVFLIAFILSTAIPKNQSYVEYETILLIFIAISMPLLFLIYGMQMFLTLKKANENISVVGFKFMKFLIAVEIITVMIVIILVLKVIINALIASGVLFESSSTDAVAGQHAVDWLTPFEKIYEAILFFLYAYLIYDHSMVKAALPCIFKDVKSEDS